MTVQDLIKDVTTAADLTTFTRYIPTPADFLLTQTVFAKVSVQDVMWRIKNTSRYVNAAKYRAFDASVPFGDRQAWQTATQGMQPSLGQKLMVGEVELLLQGASRGADAHGRLQEPHQPPHRRFRRPDRGSGDHPVRGPLRQVERAKRRIDAVSV
ncbi:hypothetical protein [Streptomyces sp. NPDC093984]|uniref:hypothetical protein n=1 Tax=Streptomyces sp. NPDC093984 TaxID=3366052 RepID=UPI003816530D